MCRGEKIGKRIEKLQEKKNLFSFSIWFSDGTERCLQRRTLLTCQWGNLKKGNHNKFYIGFQTCSTNPCDNMCWWLTDERSWGLSWSSWLKKKVSALVFFFLLSWKTELCRNNTTADILWPPSLIKIARTAFHTRDDEERHSNKSITARAAQLTET